MKLKLFLLIFYFTINCFSADIYPKELNLKNVPISDVFAHLSRFSKYTIIGDASVSDINIDVFFKQGTDISEILKTISDTYGLTKVQKGNTIIYRGKKSGDRNILYGKVYNKNTNTPVNGINIFFKKRENLEALSGEFGEYIVDGIVDGVYFTYIESPDYTYEGDFLEIKKGVNNFDFYVEKKNSANKSVSKDISKKIGTKNKSSDIIEYISLENIHQKEIQRILKELFHENLKVSISDETNSIILMGKWETVSSATKLIKQLDSKKMQVKITAEIIDVKENLFEDLGFQWKIDTQDTGKNSSGLTIGTLITSSLTGLGTVSGSSLNLVSKFNNATDVLNLTLNLLQTTQDLKINALPSLILLDRKAGYLKMTEEVIVGEVEDEDTENNKIKTEPIFKEAGIILKVLPIIKDNKTVYLDLSLEVSDFNLKKSLSPTSSNDGTFSKDGGSKVSRILETRIRIKNNDTILIGGLKKRENRKEKHSVPILGSTPVIGALFRSSSSRIEQTDLYIKIKAEILKENINE